MPRDAVNYKGNWIAKGSDAYLMWEKKEFQKLDQHLAALDKAKRKLEGLK